MHAFQLAQEVKGLLYLRAVKQLVLADEGLVVDGQHRIETVSSIQSTDESA
jgi:hypothetical protein